MLYRTVVAVISQSDHGGPIRPMTSLILIIWLDKRLIGPPWSVWTILVWPFVHNSPIECELVPVFCILMPLEECKRWSMSDIWPNDLQMRLLAVLLPFVVHRQFSKITGKQKLVWKNTVNKMLFFSMCLPTRQCNCAIILAITSVEAHQSPRTGMRMLIATLSRHGQVKLTNYCRVIQTAMGTATIQSYFDCINEFFICRPY